MLTGTGPAADTAVTAHDDARRGTNRGDPGGLLLEALPLWRTEWAVLPGMQQLLHVLAPHYHHMFSALFSAPRPWLFAHVYLPGGSRSLGDEAAFLQPGSSAPLVGVVMRVTRGVRLRDGKLLLLATGVARCRVRGAHCITSQDSPCIQMPASFPPSPPPGGLLCQLLPFAPQRTGCARTAAAAVQCG